MKSTGPLKHFVFAFLIALVVYVVAYGFIENRRSRKGPWQVTFTKAAGGFPTLIINQPSLNISNVLITFPGASAASTNVSMVFSTPQPWPFDVPFGTCVFEDTTFLPGTIVFKLFGHEVQLIPRVLTVDRKEYPWISGTTLPAKGD